MYDFPFWHIYLLSIAFINEFDLSQCCKLNAGKGRFSKSVVLLFRFGGNGLAEFG